MAFVIKKEEASDVVKSISKLDLYAMSIRDDGRLELVYVDRKTGAGREVILPQRAVEEIVKLGLATRSLFP